MKNRSLSKGVSLVGLILTVIIIIILAAVTIPQIQDRTNQANIAKQNTNISTIREEVESYYNSHDAKLPAMKDNSNNDWVYTIPIDSSLYKEVSKKGEQNEMFYIIDMDKIGKTSGNGGNSVTNMDFYIVSSVKHDIYYIKGVTIKGITYYSQITNVAEALAGNTVTPIPVPGDGSFDGFCNSPKLSSGMTPVRYDNSVHTWVTLNETEKKNLNHEWYDYRNSANKWANVMLADGSMLVWVPRYTYQIASGEHTSTAGTINVKFSDGITDDITGGYHIHPAFYWGGWDIPANAPMVRQAGGVEIKGIWVGKFESSAVNGLQDTSGDKIAIKPNVSSWRNIKIGDMFNRTTQMQSLYSTNYGLDTNLATVDAHMLKNSEWGAVAYLSKYARGANEVGLNDNTSYISGNGNYTMYTGLSASGTEYGIYDMSGSAYEYVACYLNNANGNLNTYGSALVNANAKYKDIFPVAGTDNTTNNYNLMDKAYGHAFWETSGLNNGGFGWFGDYSYFMEVGLPFLLRGGYCNDGSVAGAFCFVCNSGLSYTSVSWRVSVAVP